MRFFSKKLFGALCMCTAALPLIAHAADENKASQSGFEIGAGVGGSKISIPGVFVPDRDLGGFAYTFFGGYRIGRWAAVEASYLDGGQVSRDGVYSPTVGVTYRTEPRLATVTGVGSLPLGNFSLYARAGFAHWWYTDQFDFVQKDQPTFRERYSQTANSPIWGAGVSLFVDGGLLRLEYDQSKGNGSVQGLPLDLKLRVLTLQVAWLL
jgi:hypothetical protein